MKSNESLLLFRQYVIKIYKRYEYLIIPLLKFIILFGIFMMVSSGLGYIGVLNKIPVVLFLALLGIFLPDKWLILEILILTSLYTIGIHFALGIVTFLLLWGLYLVFMRLYPTESLLIIATIVAFKWGIGLIVPMLAGLFGGYVCIVPVLIGVFLNYTIPQIWMEMIVSEIPTEHIQEMIASIANSAYKSLMIDNTMLCTIVIFFIVFSIIYIIRKQPIDYAPYIAIVIGAAIYLTGLGLAILFFGITINIIQTVFVTLFLIAICMLAQFFACVLDYPRVEAVSFEDEENYYYVKVIPKMYLNTTTKKEKRNFADIKEEQQIVEKDE